MFKYYRTIDGRVAVTYRKNKWSPIRIKKSGDVNITMPKYEYWWAVVNAFSKKFQWPVLKPDDLDGFSEIQISKHWPKATLIKLARCKVVLLGEPYSFPDLKEVNLNDRKQYMEMVNDYLEDKIRYTPEHKVRIVRKYANLNKGIETLNLVSTGKTEEALEVLENIYPDATLLSSRYNTHKKQYGFGLISFTEFSRNIAQINYAIIELVKGMKFTNNRRLVAVKFAKSFLKKLIPSNERMS